MQTSTTSSGISDEAVSRINILCEVADRHHSVLTLSELLSLTSLSLSESELVEAWKDHPSLSSSYELKSGLIFPKAGLRGVSPMEAMLQNRKRVKAISNIAFASHFARFGRFDSTNLISVSGSNSYESPSDDDDLDFFSVTNNDAVWIFLTKSLILARVFNRTRRGSPPLCFSCTMDERYASGLFGKPADALFARDALSARVVLGNARYKRLLRIGKWMSGFFPVLYGQRLNERRQDKLPRESRVSASARLCNLILFTVVGRYIKLKAYLLNRKLAKAGKRSSLFMIEMGVDHCIYESRRYVALRQKYSNMPPQQGSSSSSSDS